MSEDKKVLISAHAFKRMSERFKTQKKGEKLLGNLLNKCPDNLAHCPYLLRDREGKISAVIDYHRNKEIWVVVTVMDFIADPKKDTAVINL